MPEKKKKEEEDAEDLPGSGLLCYLSDGAALSADDGSNHLTGHQHSGTRKRPLINQRFK